MTARTTSSGEASLRRKPLACCARAFSIVESSSNEVSTITATSGDSFFTRVRSSSPFMPGMRISVISTSCRIRLRNGSTSEADVNVLSTSIRGEESR